MVITKDLKNVSFQYDFEEKRLKIRRQDETLDYIKILGLSRAEMFSLMRFMIRVAQKGNRKSKLKGGDTKNA